MITLELVKKETGKKASKFIYQVMVDGNVVAERKSNRDYVACYVLKSVGKEIPTYGVPFFFGRMDLVGKGDSGRLDPKRIHALAVLKQS